MESHCALREHLFNTMKCLISTHSLSLGYTVEGEVKEQFF